MPIDTSIYGQIKPAQFESPLNALMQVSQVQNAQRQNKLAELTLGEKERETAADNALAGLIASGKNPADIAKELAGKGYGKQSIAYTKQASEMQKQQREAEKAQYEVAGKKLEMIGQIFGPVLQNPALYPQALAYARQQIPGGGADLPDQYDETAVKGMLGRAMSLKDQYEQVWKQKQFDLDTEKFGETKRHNKSTEGAAWGNVGLRQKEISQKDRELGMGGKPPAGYRWKQDGSGLEAIPGGPAEKDNLGTEGEKNASGYGLRMQEAEKVIKSVAVSDPGAQKPNIVETVVGGNNTAANISRSSTRQQYRQAQEDWVRAKLRKESGAVIGEEEMNQEIKTYFPQPGDRPAVIKQKEQARSVAMEAMKTSAGKAGKNLNTSSNPEIDALLKKYGG